MKISQVLVIGLNWLIVHC